MSIFVLVLINFSGHVQCPSDRNILEELSQGKLTAAPSSSANADPVSHTPREEVCRVAELTCVLDNQLDK